MTAVRQAEAGRGLTDIYIDGDACPVREEIYRVAARLKINVFVVANGSRPIRPPGVSNVRMVMVGDTADAADDWIAEHITAADVCVTSDLPLASRCLKIGARVVSPTGKNWTHANIGNALAGREIARHLRELGTEYPRTRPLDQKGQVPVPRRARYGAAGCIARGSPSLTLRQLRRRRPSPDNAGRRGAAIAVGFAHYTFSRSICPTG